MPLYIVSNSLVLLPFALCVHKHCFLRVKQPAKVQKNYTKNAPQFTILRSKIKKKFWGGGCPYPPRRLDLDRPPKYIWTDAAAARGAHDAPSGPLVGWGAGTPPHTPPHSAPRSSCPPDTTNPGDATGHHHFLR